MIDDSSHVKNGEHSVGGYRQWRGTKGKVENCQVAVYGALSAEKYYVLIYTEFSCQRAEQAIKSVVKQQELPKKGLHRAVR